MAQETRRRWTITNGPSLSDLIASLAASGDYTPEFTLQDERGGSEIVCRVKIVELSRYRCASGVWKIVVQPFRCGLKPSRGPMGADIPVLMGFLRGMYIFGPMRIGELREILPGDENGRQCKHCGMGEAAHFSVSEGPPTCANFTPRI